MRGKNCSPILRSATAGGHVLLIYSYPYNGNQKKLLNCHTTHAGVLKCKISHQLSSNNWTHLMNKYIFLVVISKEKSKTNRDQDFCVGKLENANQSSVAFKSENENFAMLSSSTRKTRHVFQTLTLTNGDKLNDCVKKIKSTKGETNKEDGKKETGLN